MSTIRTAILPKPKQSTFGWISENWFGVFVVVYGLWVFTPFLAPIFMNLGWSAAGRAVYFTYAFFCHQLPERSCFFFGEKTMYSLGEIQAAWQNTPNPIILRQFIATNPWGGRSPGPIA